MQPNQLRPFVIEIDAIFVIVTDAIFVIVLGAILTGYTPSLISHSLSPNRKKAQVLQWSGDTG